MSVMGVQKCCPCARMNYIINKPIIIIYIFNQGRMTEMMAIEDSDFSTITHLGVEDGLNDNLFSLPIKISLIVLAVISSVSKYGNNNSQLAHSRTVFCQEEVPRASEFSHRHNIAIGGTLELQCHTYCCQYLLIRVVCAN